MMKRAILISFLLLFTQIGFAQVPGYMGKHLVIGYSLNFSGAFLSPTAHKTSNNSPSGLLGDGINFQGMNNTHVLNMDYIYHYRKAVCLLIQYSRTGVDYVGGNGVYYNGDPKKPAILNSFGVGLGIKLFKRCNLAPYGPYVKWEFVMAVNNLIYNNKSYFREDPSNSSIRIQTTAGSGIVESEIFGIGYSWGRQRIFKDKFVFDRGVRFLIYPAGIAEMIADDGNFTSVESEFESQGTMRIFRHQFISFHLGIGFLAF